MQVQLAVRQLGLHNSFSECYQTDLGRFRLGSRNQRMIRTPIPESESESFVVSFGGVGIGVGIVVIGIDLPSLLFWDGTPFWDFFAA